MDKFLNHKRFSLNLKEIAETSRKVPNFSF